MATDAEVRDRVRTARQATDSERLLLMIWEECRATHEATLYGPRVSANKVNQGQNVKKIKNP